MERMHRNKYIYSIYKATLPREPASKSVALPTLTHSLRLLVPCPPKPVLLQKPNLGGDCPLTWPPGHYRHAVIRRLYGTA